MNPLTGTSFMWIALHNKPGKNGTKQTGNKNPKTLLL